MPKDGAVSRLSVSIGQYSTAGRKPCNQDFHGALVPDGSVLHLKGIALALADGISSSAVSHIAAETAVKSFLDDYYCASDAWSVKSAGQRVIAATNAWLHTESCCSRYGGDRDRGYVCTFSALILKARKAHLFHVGDSRIHRLAGGGLEQLTLDHRTVLSATESYLGRALGLAPSVEIDYGTLELKPGDVFVLTTDGVHDYVSGREVAACLAGAGDLDAAARTIVETALAKGSDDNLTLQVVRVDSLPEPDAAAVLEPTETLPPAPVPVVPSDFEGYRILRQLHASSRSHIFVAVEQESGAQVALKVPSRDLRGDSAYLRRFAMEEWVARRLNSPHVLRAAPVHRRRSSLYVVTELIEGQTLRQWMRDNPQPDLERVRGIVEQVARGLHAFHRKDMLHQDLRPENIMIDREGTVRIIDFGAVRVAGVAEAWPASDTGDILGTHQYTAPECFLGYQSSERSDLFSLGVIAYEMLTGRLPYGDRAARVRSAKALAALQYRAAERMTPRVPGWVDAALAKAVHPDPGRRYETLFEFVADLRRPNARHSPTTFVPLMERDPLRFWQALAAVQLLVILLLLLFH